MKTLLVFIFTTTLSFAQDNPCSPEKIKYAESTLNQMIDLQQELQILVDQSGLPELCKKDKKLWTKSDYKKWDETMTKFSWSENSNLPRPTIKLKNPRYQLAFGGPKSDNADYYPGAIEDKNGAEHFRVRFLKFAPKVEIEKTHLEHHVLGATLGCLLAPSSSRAPASVTQTVVVDRIYFEYDSQTASFHQKFDIQLRGETTKSFLNVDKEKIQKLLNPAVQ